MNRRGAGVNRIAGRTIGREAIFYSAHFGELAAFFVRIRPLCGNCASAAAPGIFGNPTPKGQSVRRTRQGRRSPLADFVTTNRRRLPPPGRAVVKQDRATITRPRQTKPTRLFVGPATRGLSLIGGVSGHPPPHGDQQRVRPQQRPAKCRSQRRHLRGVARHCGRPTDRPVKAGEVLPPQRPCHPGASPGGQPRRRGGDLDPRGREAHVRRFMDLACPARLLGAQNRPGRRPQYLPRPARRHGLRTRSGRTPPASGRLLPPTA